ncbi:MAG: DNRLRE domain-containing protein [Oscillospiraceae bacterium]|jgi:hypothetical protein|nr:DNRLRE domain-containing protein [Oscillospiraceae bacterium]
MKKAKAFTTALLITAVIVSALTGCRKSDERRETVTIGGESSVVTAWVTSELPDQNILSADGGLDAMPVGGGYQALVRIELPSGISENELRGAYLCLTQASGDKPSLAIAAANKPWSFGDITWSNSLGDSGFAGEPKAVDAQKVGGVWKLDVTEYVRRILAGDAPNYGVVLSRSDGVSDFGSGFAEEAVMPKLEVTYSGAETAEKFGKYDYTAQGSGNCLSYALRDISGIYYGDLFSESDTVLFQQTYDEGGTDAALQFVKANVFSYIERNKQALGIVSYREIDGFGAPIDTDTEYRVCLRVGFRDRSFPEGIQVDEDFDYHLKVQTSDGTWAEKTPGEPARVCPGTYGGCDVARFPWDESYLWGYEKWNDFYDSAAVYFAVTKDGAGFTQHRTET